jgi:HEPN domain-containing protein
LILHDQAFPRTHDLRLLIQLTIVINPSFGHYQEAAELLTPYATAFRYPSDVMQLTTEELQEAIKKASEIFNFIKTLLSDEIRSFLI